jgi:uncharacterized protein YecE (DUF72 family)
MDFGKVTSVRQLDTISFRLPTEDGRMPIFPSVSAPEFYLGCPVWGKKEWVGQVYPPGTAPKDYLKFYARQFNTIELNTTFYRTPDPTTVERWRKTVPPDFKFCPKVFQDISRFENLLQIPALTQRFCESILHFGDHLGTLFMQLPPSFGPNKIVILKRFFTLLPPGIRLAVEFRHPAWFFQGQLIHPAFDLLAEKRISTVITDVAGRRDVVHSTLTTRTAVIRFVGNALHPSDTVRIDQWVERLGSWFKKGVNQVYFFLHQPEEAGALELITYLNEALNQRYPIHLRNWDPKLARPAQKELFG